MKIAVVGATGPTGQLVVSYALLRGHHVIAYVRRPDALANRDGLTIAPGQLDDTRAFAEAITGCSVVICTLGSRSWNERTFMSLHLPMVTNAMSAAGVKRLVLMSALGGGQVPRSARGLNRFVFQLLSRFVFGDRTTSELALATTGLRWSAVYPGFLSDEIPKVQYVTTPLDELRKSPRGKIPRAAVAEVLIDLAEHPTSDGQRLAIGPA